MIPGTNPFRKTPAGPSSTTSEPANVLGIQQVQERPKAPPPTPAQRGSSLRNQVNSDLDAADLQELDDLEREQQHKSSEGKPPPPRPRNASHSRTPSFGSSPNKPTPPVSRARKISNLTLPVLPAPSAPDPNLASTPHPFGDALPTPDIVPRDLSRPIYAGGGEERTTTTPQKDDEMAALQAKVDALLDKNSTN